MSRLRRNKPIRANVPGSRPQDCYRTWLENSQHYKVCAYCLSSQDTLQIEHYAPEGFLRAAGKNPHTPGNLFLACSNCNFNKLDYHPQNTQTRRLKSLPLAQRPRVLNSFKHDYSVFFAIVEDGYFSASKPPTTRMGKCARGNIVLFGFDERHNLAAERASLLSAARILENVLSEVDLPVAEYNPDIRRAARTVWKNRLLFEAFGIPLSQKLKEFAQGEWTLWAKANGVK